MPTSKTKPVSESTLNKRRAKWVKALTGGRYKRTADGYLKQDGPDGRPRYCCLGVACNIFLKETGIGQWKKDKYGDWEFIVIDANGRPDASSSVPPKAVQDYFGLRNSTGEFYKHGQPILDGIAVNSLVSANDDWSEDELGFKGIAKLIADRTPGIFKSPRRKPVKA